MYIWEAVLSELKLAVFGSVTFDCGDFFSIDYECQDGDDCCIYLQIWDVMDWNIKVFGRAQGKYLKRGRKTYNVEYDRYFVDRWVDSFLKDIAVWLDKDDDALVYLKRLYNKRESCNYARFVDLDRSSNNILVRLGGEIGHEKVVVGRTSKYLYYYLCNYDVLDDYELEVDEDGNVTDEAMSIFVSKLESLRWVDKIAELFLDNIESDRLGRNCCQILDLGNGKYKVEFSYWEVFNRGKEELAWLEAIGVRDQYGSLVVEGTYEELETMVSLVNKV